MCILFLQYNFLIGTYFATQHKGRNREFLNRPWKIVKSAQRIIIMLHYNNNFSRFSFVKYTCLERFHDLISAFDIIKVPNQRTWNLFENCWEVDCLSLSPEIFFEELITRKYDSDSTYRLQEIVCPRAYRSFLKHYFCCDIL